MAGVFDEGGVVGDMQPAAGQRAQAEVVLYSISKPESRGVEEAYVVENHPPDVETDSHSRRDSPVTAIGHPLDQRRERRGIETGRQQVLLEAARNGADRGVIRERRDRSYVA